MKRLIIFLSLAPTLLIAQSIPNPPPDYHDYEDCYHIAYYPPVMEEVEQDVVVIEGWQETITYDTIIGYREEEIEILDHPTYETFEQRIDQRTGFLKWCAVKQHGRLVETKKKVPIVQKKQRVIIHNPVTEKITIKRIVRQGQFYWKKDC